MKILSNKKKLNLNHKFMIIYLFVLKKGIEFCRFGTPLIVLPSTNYLDMVGGHCTTSYSHIISTFFFQNNNNNFF